MSNGTTGWITVLLTPRSMYELRKDVNVFALDRVILSTPSRWVPGGRADGTYGEWCRVFEHVLRGPSAVGHFADATQAGPPCKSRVVRRPEMWRATC